MAPGRPATDVSTFTPQTKNVNLTMRITHSEVRPFVRKESGVAEEMVVALGIASGGHRMSVAFFGKSADVGKELHAEHTYVLKGGYCKIPHETSLTTTNVDIVFDKTCEKSAAGELNDQVPIKTLCSALARLGAEDGNSVVIDMKCVVVKVLGHSSVVQKKDGSPLDRYQVNVVDVSVMQQLTVTFFGRCQVSVLENPLKTGDILVLRGLQLKNRLGGRDAVLGNFGTFDEVEDSEIETVIEKKGIEQLMSLKMMSVAGKERTVVEVSVPEFNEAVEGMVLEEDFEYLPMLLFRMLFSVFHIVFLLAMVFSVCNIPRFRLFVILIFRLV